MTFIEERGIVVLTIQTLDAHTGGEPLRLIIRGFPEPQGATMLERREWLRENHDDLRTAIMLEPRGHADMHTVRCSRLPSAPIPMPASCSCTTKATARCAATVSSPSPR